MKNIFLIIVVLFFPFKNNKTSIKNENTGIISTEIKEKISINNAENYEVIKKVLYKGTLNGTIKISLYFNEQKNPCGGNSSILNAMYKYDNQNKWILLNVTTNQQKTNYCLVEDNFSGVLFLKKQENTFSGYWISPNVKKQFKVELEDQLLDVKYAKDHTIIEQLDDILFDDLIFGKNDC